MIDSQTGKAVSRTKYKMPGAAFVLIWHTNGPNWPTFLMFASRYLKTQPLPAKPAIDQVEW